MQRIKSAISTIAIHIRKDRKIIAASLAAGFVLTSAFLLLSSYIYARDIQRGIADSVLRLHVVANSNTPEDQALKLHVRDAVLDLMRDFLTGEEDKQTVINLVEANFPAIITRAENVLAEHNAVFMVEAQITRERFPTRHYDGISLPPGYYTALRINIGTATGTNWWCIAFPPLCFVDATRPQNTRTPTLQNVLTAEQYRLVTTTPASGVNLRARFRIVELWQNIMR